ncbi:MULTISPECIES: hypothetical protein [Brevundimonas]|uniref:hypothetical protein n=1 Tax=Brevundimonas TaxID=41275 RepID=UPI0011D1A6EF|nr:MULTISPECIES: hypothetical protein [Brevundimonas]
MVIFNLLYILSCSYALLRGGAPERIGAVILIANFQFSHWLIAPLESRYADVEWAMFCVDGVAFLALYALSISSTRFWPIWMAAIQGVVAISHLAGLRPDVISWAYGNAVALWAWVLVAILASATWRHQFRLRRFGSDPAWPRQLPPSYRAGMTIGAGETQAEAEAGP